MRNTALKMDTNTATLHWRPFSSVLYPLSRSTAISLLPIALLLLHHHGFVSIRYFHQAGGYGFMLNREKSHDRNHHPPEAKSRLARRRYPG
jgi:hypothetical protein